MDSARTTGTLAGKIAVVTGSTSGSGRAVARRFAAEGADVVLLARGKERLIAEAQMIEGAVPIVTDVGDPDSVRKAFAEIEERFGKLDILVNNAGVYRPCRVEELSDFDIDRQVRTNYSRNRLHLQGCHPAFADGRPGRHRQHLERVHA